MTQATFATLLVHFAQDVDRDQPGFELCAGFHPLLMKESPRLIHLAKNT